ncbi:hypothetical protein [Floridanema evergladense]|uniref:Uncharacterized protein n=1 Tax=Floridaenema evergladense BLCC-F167 TaxID=3153639 RepID=A0ABV4WNY9_9CYAN
MIHKKNYRLFNLLFLPLVGLNLVSIAIFNLIVDPYGIIENLTAPEENQPDLASDLPPPVFQLERQKIETKNQSKPTTLEQRNKYRAERFKINLATLSITKIQPKMVILGTSTALKLSTDHPALTTQPVYNLALPGAKMRDIKSYFDDTLANHPDLQEVLLSLDFFAFGEQKKVVKPSDNQSEKPQEVTVVRTNKYSVTIPELIKINFSLDTFAASLRKVAFPDLPAPESDEQQPPLEGPKKSQVLSARIDRKSSSRLKSKKKKIIKKKGIEKAKETKEQQFTKSNKKESKVIATEQEKKTPVAKPTVKPLAVQALVKPKGVAKNSNRYNNFKRVVKLYLVEKSLYKDYSLSEEELAAFKAIVDICKKRKIKLTVFIAPVHTAQLELINRAGIWSEFENWKREIVTITPVWDFASYSNLVTEPIDDNMKNFVDTVHYQHEVANLIMQRIYNYQAEKVPPNFGKLISKSNIEPHLKVIRQQRLSWKRNNMEMVQFVMELKKETDLGK